MKYRFSQLPIEQHTHQLNDKVDTTTDRQRLVWPTQVGGFLVCVGFMVGVANMAFFPSAICAEGQAGNFVLVYLICVIFIGFPITYLHLCLGQYSGCNPTEVFGKLCPLLRGIGWSWLLIMIPLLLFSNINTTWSIHYLYVSADSLVHGKSVPWQIEVAPTQAPDISAYFHEAVRNSIFYGMSDNTNNSTSLKVAQFTPETTTARYFHHLYHTPAPTLVMKVPVGSTNELPVIDKEIVLGNLEPSMVASLAVAWLLVFFCVFNGVHTMNKVVYVTATLPYVIMIVLLTRAITLEGAGNGLALLIPDVGRLSEKAVWIQALKMIFFDLQVSVGVLMSIASHNRFHTNVFRDAVALVTIDVVTSLLAAAVAFCFLGFLAVQLEESDVRAMCRGQVAPHLLWDQILRALGHLAPSEAALFSFLYQLMLVICAIDCTFTWCETLTSSLQNKIPLLKDRPRILTAIVCVVFFLLSLPCCFQGGVHIYNLFVMYSMKWNVMIVAILQFIAVSYVYGVNNLFRDIRKMLRLPDGHDPSILMRLIGPTSVYIRSVWTWICPATIAILLACDVILKQEDMTTELNRMPGDSNAWCLLSLIPLLPIPLFAVWELCVKNRGKDSCRPDEWTKMKTPNDDTSEFHSEACLMPGMGDCDGITTEQDSRSAYDHTALKLEEDRMDTESYSVTSASYTISGWGGDRSLFEPSNDSSYFELKALARTDPSTVVDSRDDDTVSASSSQTPSVNESAYRLPPLQLTAQFDVNLTMQPLPSSFVRREDKPPANQQQFQPVAQLHHGGHQQKPEQTALVAAEPFNLGSLNLFKECQGDSDSELSDNSHDTSSRYSIPSDPNESLFLSTYDT